MIRGFPCIFGCRTAPRVRRDTCAPALLVRRAFAPSSSREYEALQAARAAHATAAGQQRYARRAGIEGTISQSVRAFGARYTRYRGLSKTHLQQVITAVALTVRRVIAWSDNVPKAAIRTSQFAALAA